MYFFCYISLSNVSRICSCSNKATNVDLTFSTKWLNSSRGQNICSSVYGLNENLKFFCIIFFSVIFNTFDKTYSRSWYRTVLFMIFNIFLHIYTNFSASASFNNIELRCFLFINIPSKIKSSLS